jgi:ankyrin repeat protein
MVSFVQTLYQTLYSGDGKATWVERVIARIKENSWVAAAVALGAGVLALVKYAEAIKELVGPLFTNRAEAARRTLAGLHLEFTTDAFVQSAEKGDRHAVKAFLAAGIDPNKRDRGHDNALSHAVRIGDVHMVRALLRAGADMSVKDRDEWTALDRAVEGIDEIMRLLLKRDPSAELLDHAFVMAAKYGNKEMLALLKEHGANVEKVGSKAITDAARFCRTPEQSCENVTYLLTLRIDPNSRDKDGRTALHEAASNSQLVRVLLENGADVHAKVNDDDHFGGSTPLLIASGRGCLEAVEVLLDAGSDIRVQNKRGETALIVTLQASNEQTVEAEIVDVLLRAGADVNAKDHHGMTALMCASQDRRIAIVQNLLNNLADVNAQNNEGFTVLMMSSSGIQEETVKFLLEHGANINLANDEGQTALMLAVEHRNGLDTVEILLDKNADVNASDATGKTALMYAAENGRPQMIRALLEYGAQVDKRERDGRTALQIAEEHSDAKLKREMVRVLNAAGAK